MRAKASLLHLQQLHSHLLKEIVLLSFLSDALEFEVLKQAALYLLHILQKRSFQILGPLASETQIAFPLLVKRRHHIVVEKLVGVHHVIHFLSRQVLLPFVLRPMIVRYLLFGEFRL